MTKKSIYHNLTGADPGFLDMYKWGRGGGSFANFNLFFSKIPFFLKVLLRPNYFMFIGYLKTGCGEGVQANLLDLPLVWHLVDRNLVLINFYTTIK